MSISTAQKKLANQPPQVVKAKLEAIKLWKFARTKLPAPERNIVTLKWAQEAVAKQSGFRNFNKLVIFHCTPAQKAKRHQLNSPTKS